MITPVLINKTPNGNYSYSDSIGCDLLDVIFTPDVIDANNNYLWDFGNGNTTNSFGVTSHQYSQIGCFDVTLSVTSKEGCVATILDTNAICVYRQPIADFMASRYVFSSLETPIVQFTNLSQHSTIYYWQFGDGQTSFTEHPNHTYADGANKYMVKLMAGNVAGCLDSTYKYIEVYQEIAIYVPNTFTPNNDIHNEVFIPILTDGFVEETYHLTIFNRWGELIFESRDKDEAWDGNCTDSENGCQIGTYVWKLTIAIEETGEFKSYMGHVNLIR
jgi:gliding motility-associated-like protein